VGHAFVSTVDSGESAMLVSLSASSSALLPSLSAGTVDDLGLDGSAWHSAAVSATFSDSSEIDDDLGVLDGSINKCHAYFF